MNECRWEEAVHSDFHHRHLRTVALRQVEDFGDISGRAHRGPSDYDLISIPIRKGSRNFISITYSRGPNLRVAAHLQKPGMSNMKPASIRAHVGAGIGDSEAV